MAKIQCVFIGIDDYRDPLIGRLQCAARDAQEMSDLFEGIGANVQLLLNSQATLIGIRRAIWSLARNVTVDDTAIVYYAGHGARATVPKRGSEPRTIPCLVPYDAHHEDLIATAIQMEEIGHCFESIPCKRVLFLFDSCYSGSMADCRAYRIPGERAEGPLSPVLQSIAGEGTVILAASKEFEPAFEDPNAGHGVFTEFLIEVLSGKAPYSYDEGVSLDLVHKYLQEKVPKKTRHRFNNTQTPVQHGTFTERFIFPVMQSITHRTLASFPYHFLPITIVVGDRRETTPKTSGDMFALSASSAELRWILSLGLPRDTEIVSDKVFRQASLEYLQENYGGCNLLVIGSPAANLLTRQVNESALFPFAIPSSARDKYSKMSEEIDAIAHNRAKLVNFATDPRNRESLDFYMNLYRKGGFIDPTYSHFRRGERIPHDRDYGTVTIARNPYSNPKNANFLSIMAAGVSLPATTHALKLLSNAREEFAERPFGGIFCVELTEMDWIKRIKDAMPQWSTDEYDISKFRKSLLELKTRMKEIEEVDIKSIDDRLEFIEQITTTTFNAI
jgi:hypothetical protein